MWPLDEKLRGEPELLTRGMAFKHAEAACTGCGLHAFDSVYHGGVYRRVYGDNTRAKDLLTRGMDFGDKRRIWAFRVRNGRIVGLH